MLCKAVGSRVAVGAVLLYACTPADPGPSPAGGARGAAAESPVCLQGEPFVARGPMAVRASEPGDAHRIGRIRWEPYEGCERLVIDLQTGVGEPASRAGELRGEVLRDLGVLRLTLPGIESVAPEATDARLEGTLARAAYVVREPAGRWIHVDVHLGEPAEGHVTTLDDPARIVVDLRPGGPPLRAPAPTGARVVVLEPRQGSASYPLTVAGYARTFEANVVARLEQDGNEVAEDFTTATDWVEAWGHFSLTFDGGPGGAVVVHVGEYSARDGIWEGVRIDLEMR
jgi:hypothetical protein